MKTTVRNVAGIVVATLAIATSALASDLTGTWEGTFKCKGLDGDGAPSSAASDGVSVMEITQTGADLKVSVDGRLFSGAAIDMAGKEDQQGLAVIEACDNDGDPDATNEMGLLGFKVTPGGLAGALKAAALTAEGGHASCKSGWRRVDVANPAVAACPVFYSCVCTGALGCGLAASGAAGSNGDVVADLSNTQRTTSYENGNSNGWVCVAQ